MLDTRPVSRHTDTTHKRSNRTMYNTAKPVPFASLKRVGGLYHWRIGSIGGSFYRAKRRSGASQMLVTTALFGAVACGAQPPAPSYSAIVTLATGDEYVIEHSASLDDCNRTIADMPASSARCTLDK